MPDEYEHLRESADEAMREENFGPVSNPDGTPTELTKQMLAGTGRSMRPPFDFEEPEWEDFDADDWKVLFMLLCENRGKLDLEGGLTDHGKRLLHNVQRKIGINAVGVDIGTVPPAGDIAYCEHSRADNMDASEWHRLYLWDSVNNRKIARDNQIYAERD